MTPKFAISSLLAAGFLTPQSADAMPGRGLDTTFDKNSPPTLFDIFRLDHRYTLAGHRSHSSHSSHSSHRSSTGGGYVYSPPANTYIPPAYTPPAAPPANGPLQLLPLPGNSSKFSEIVKQVQMALLAYGYYSGQIDGLVGPGTRTAIQSYQTDVGLRVTGTVTPQLLDSLRILAQ